MRKDPVKQGGDGLLANLRYRQKWTRITSVLSVFVAVGTISALMLPAITMNQPVCGLEAHTHGENCYAVSAETALLCSYETLGIHAHGPECLDEEGNLLCQVPDFVVHTHDELCWDAGGNLVCGLKEAAAHNHEDGCYQATEVVVEEGHAHGDECYAWGISETPTCGMEESEGHAHGEGCFAAERTLVCAEEEREGHSHGEACYETAAVLGCGLEEAAGHSHAEGCYGEDGNLLCQEAEQEGRAHEDGCYTQEQKLTCAEPEEEGHTHGEGCWVEAGGLLCLIPESQGHSHEESCFGPVKGELLCTQEEKAPVMAPGEPELLCQEPEIRLHTHEENCFTPDSETQEPVLTCTQPEILAHQHGESCFGEREVRTLTCELTEHSHTGECFPAEELPEYACGLEEHTHDESCLDEEGNLTCALPEHSHGDDCRLPALTEEEKAAVEALDALLEPLPTSEEAQARQKELEEAGDEEALDAYMSGLYTQVGEAKAIFDTLTDDQKLHLKNGEKLEGLIALFSPEAKSLVLADYGDDSLLDTSATVTAMDGDIQTVGGNQGIVFQLFDYSTNINTYLGQQIPGINTSATATNNYFTFRGKDGGVSYAGNDTYDKDGFNFYDEDGVADGKNKPDHATVKYNLKNGYPALDLTHHGYLDASGIAVDGASLGVLFGAGNNSNYVREYNCANTPLKYNANTGYYTYYSSQNAADFNTGTNTWYVRNYMERGKNSTLYHDGSYWDFMPFNHKETTKVNDANGRNYNFESAELDYWYGMTMSVDFFQPKNGKVNNEDMIFEFSGDDDVWVFIDDKLVLDLGGTHGQVSGSINFETGFVEMYLDWAGTNAKTDKLATNYKASTLYECYKAAYEEAGMTPAQVQDELSKVFVKVEGQTTSDVFGNVYDVYRFKDYTTHSLNHFYMERGSGCSNCNIKFNLPTLPKESLTVGKDIVFVDDQGKPDADVSDEAETFAKQNLTYTFRILESETNKPLFANMSVHLIDDMGNSTGEVVTVDRNGYFLLRADQRVRFDNMQNYTTTSYYVEESIPTNYDFQYGDISYGDGGLMEGIINSETRFTTYRTSEMKPDQSNIVVYTNQVISEKMSFLKIGKEVLPGSDLKEEDVFPFKVSLGGIPVDAGTKFIDINDSSVLVAETGGVIYLKSGQSVMLNNPIIAGTEFRVEELTKNGWQVDRVEGAFSPNGDVDYSEGEIIHITGAVADGEMPVNTTATVTAYNKTYSFGTAIPLSKQFKGVNSQLSDFARYATFRIEQVSDAAGTALPDTVERIPSVIPDVTLECRGQEVTSGSITIGYLSTAEKKDYFYRIREESSSAEPGELFINDESVYIVQVTVTEGNAAITAVYKDGVSIGKDATAAFVNTLAVVELPATGGPGIQMYTFSGWAMILTACALMYNAKRKQRKGAR